MAYSQSDVTATCASTEPLAGASLISLEALLVAIPTDVLTVDGDSAVPYGRVVDGG